MNPYRIAYKGLKNGTHKMCFDIEADFFKNFEKSRISESAIKVDIELDIRSTMLVFDFNISGTYQSDCDRCTALIDVLISGEDQVIFKLSEEENVTSEEVIFIDPRETHIDLTDTLYQLIHAHLPISEVRDCEAEDYKHCDHQVLDRLEYRAPEEPKEDQQNPLWGALKDLDL